MDSSSPDEKGVITSAQLARLREFSAPVIASAIELCDVRLPNTGFSNASVRCTFPDLPAIAGYAATARIRTASPPMEGGRYSYARTDWWGHVLSTPAPRILVIEDMDSRPGVGAFVGEVYSCILRAMECVGAITNGAVRDLNQVHASGFQVFAGSVSISHAYAHVFDFGGAVDVAGLKIKPGELIHGDLHGFQTVPADIVDEVIAAADRILETRRSLTGLCRSPAFSFDKLAEAVKLELQPKRKTG